MKNDWQKVYPNPWGRAEKILKNDGVVILPTDTLYGIIGSALSKKAVRRIYEIKGRDGFKPLIVLINSYKDLEIFGIKLKKDQLDSLNKIWPGKVSVEFCYKNKKFSYIRGNQDYNAFRMVGIKNKNLFNLINNVGPLVAPSANLQGLSPSETIKDAKKYFNKMVDLYIDGGKRKISPSTLVKLNGENFEILRQGAVKINTKNKK